MAAEKKATRAAYGETLVELVEQGIDVVAVEADLSGSTTTKKLGAAHSERLVNVGIAEQDMVGVAAGLSLTGHTAFTGSFAVFGTGRVKLIPAPEGTGVIAGGPVRDVLEAAGISDIVTKSIGTNNKINVARATMQGLSQLRSAEEVARLRGKTVEEILG